MLKSLSISDILYVSRNVNHSKKSILIDKFDGFSDQEKESISSKKFTSDEVKRLVDLVNAKSIQDLREMTYSDMMSYIKK